MGGARVKDTKNYSLEFKAKSHKEEFVISYLQYAKQTYTQFMYKREGICT